MTFQRTLHIAAILGCTLAPSAWGQAARTWVSGVGDDANPCSRTAPCKTFAGAVSKTADGGEIDVIDAGGFGAVTITKNLTIDGTPHQSGVLASGVNAITITSATPIKVVLKGLNINGGGTGMNGVRVLNSATVRLDDVNIQQFTQACLSITPGAAAKVSVRNSTLTECGQTGIAANGLNAAASLFVTLENVQAAGNTIGLEASNGARVTATGSYLSLNATGVQAITDGVISLDGAIVNYNTTAAVVSNGPNSVVRIANSAVQDNTGPGLSSVNAGAIISWGSNRVRRNSPDGAPTITAPAI